MVESIAPRLPRLSLTPLTLAMLIFLSSLGGFWIWARYPEAFLIPFASVAIVGIASARAVAALASTLRRTLLSGLAALAQAAALMLFLYLPSHPVRWALTTLTALVITVFVSYTQLWVRYPVEFPLKRLEYISSGVNLLTFFALAATATETLLLLGWPFWWLTLAILVASGVLSLQVFLLHGLPLKAVRLHSAAMAVMLAELFAAVHFLPTRPLVSAFFVTIGYYALLGLSKWQLYRIDDRRVLWRYISLGIATLILVMLTARWI